MLFWRFHLFILPNKQCSVSCGLGWRLREIECRFPNGKPSSLCKSDLKPSYYEQCDAGECPKWQYGAWSTCSSDCGEGLRRRLVVCRNSSGVIFDDKNCDLSNKPEETTNCTGHMCAKWIVGNWSQCYFKTCTMIRSIRCGFENGTSMPDSYCDKSEKPNYVSDCKPLKFFINSR